MKKRGGFDAGKIKRFFILHLEKIALVVVGLCFLLFVYSAATQERFTGKTPEQITEEANSARQYVEQSPWDPKLAAIETRDLSVAVELSRKPVPKVPFEQPIVWMPRPRTTTVKRIQPPLLAVLEPRAVLETGLFSVKGPNWGKMQQGMMQGMGMPGAGGEIGSPDGGPGRRGKNKTRRGPGTGAMPGDATMPGEGAMDPGMMGGYGMMTGMPPGAVQHTTGMGAELRGVRFVVITGLVPYTDQIAKYAEAFDEASWKSMTPLQQYPFYYWYAVERAEVTDQSDPENLTWTPLDIIGAYREAVLKWAAAAGEVVAPYHIDQRLCFPLGPLVDRQWDKAVAHPPEIPLASNVMSMAAINPAMIQDPNSAGFIDKNGDGVPDLNLPDPAAMGTGAATGYGYGAGMMPGSDGGGEAMGGMSLPGFGGMGGGMGLPGLPGMGMPGMGGMPGSDMGMGMGGYGMGGGYGGEGGYDPYGTGQMVQSSPYRLFRFFDFAVQEGKRYRYRMKLKLINPNYGLEARFVADPKTTKEQMIETPWSEPTPEVHVRGTSGLLAGKVEPSRGTREPKAIVIFRHWDPADGSTAIKESSLELGQVANFAGKNVDRFDWTTFSNQPVPSVDFKTDMMLVDVRGGEPLDGDKDFSEPGEMLFMGPDGRLIVRTELDDWDRYSTDQQTLEVLKNPNPGMGPGMPGGEAGMYDPGGEGGGPMRGRQRGRTTP
jgi:hypothetical protein